MSMGFMVAMAGRRNGDDRMDEMEMRRRRDERGRYMGTDHSTHMGDDPEMRRDRYRGMTDARYPAEPPYLDGRPQRMRDNNVVNIRDYQDRRRIGFGAEDAEDEDGGAEMRQYGRRYDPDRPARMHYGQHQQHQQQMGHTQGDGEHLTREEAEEWVEGMQSEDGKPGPRWPMHEIERYAGNFGVQGDEIIEFWAVINALYSDYCKVARKYGVDKIEFWADLAKAFIRDKDAEPGKTRLYYECIAKKKDA